ncbi:hypothetical protein GCM10023208_21590 [Erythrobacter westpacificensis]|uniref:DUF3144 domain-containing protein n=1 Tax=Erythrobacter westpacificensis TaxID=1055231 RepID=A0ABP9KIG1_9SPHN
MAKQSGTAPAMITTGEGTGQASYEDDRAVAPTAPLKENQDPITKPDFRDHFAKLEVLAVCMFECSLDTFRTADVYADTPREAVAMKREAASIGKAYASLLMTIDRLQETARKEVR